MIYIPKITVGGITAAAFLAVLIMLEVNFTSAQ